MSSDSSVYRKGGSASEISPAQNGDHRKRRRNRTTQSCLNCHTSKRLCDRKRPACARCTQLGLTGLCVYEVDDPTQRTETHESSRLIKRVAELESVIRELKNKPHPRWVQASDSGENCYARLHFKSPVIGKHKLSSSSNAPSLANSAFEQEGSRPCVPIYAESEAEIFPATTNLKACADCLHKDSPYYQGSALSTPSPGLLTPTDEYSSTQVGIAGTESLTPPQDYDSASMFLTYPDVMGCAGSGIFDEEYRSHCGCLRELSNYHVMFELSLRLRKASDILSRSPIHLPGGFHFCLLYQTISNLDNLMTNALNDITTAVENLPDPLMMQVPTTNENWSTLTSCHKRPMNNMQDYHFSSNSNSLASVDDLFMSWEPLGVVDSVRLPQF